MPTKWLTSVHVMRTHYADGLKMEGYTMTEEEKLAAEQAAAAQAAEEAAKAAAQQAGNEDNKTGDELKQFTQAQIDEMIQKAKGQVKKKYEDYDSIKEQLQKIEDERKQKELDEMTEVERLKKILEEKEGELNTLATAQKTAAIKAAFEKAAKAADIPEKYLDDARLLAGVNNDTDVATIEETVKALVESKPFLVEKKETQQKEIGGANNPSNNRQAEKSGEALLKEAADKARRTGRVEDKIAYVALKRELGL